MCFRFPLHSSHLLIPPVNNTYLHRVVVDGNPDTLENAKVSLQVAPRNVVVGVGVVRGAMEEDARASVVLHHVVVNEGAACKSLHEVT